MNRKSDFDFKAVWEPLQRFVPSYFILFMIIHTLENFLGICSFKTYTESRRLSSWEGKLFAKWPIKHPWGVQLTVFDFTHLSFLYNKGE